jgi:hypothetical protein
MNSTTPPGSADRSERVAHLRAILEGREPPSPAEPVQDARDQKIDFRVSLGEREMWERAAQAKGVSTSEFVRGVVNPAAEEVLAAAYASE